MQQAQERAGTLGTRLIFPLIFCEFPAFFAVAVGPAVLRIIDALKLV
jgi:tight adherence protein C